MPDEIELSPGMAQAAREALTGLANLQSGKSDLCFMCKQSVQRREQRGRCVYLYPCGCYYQGQLPRKGKTK